jgi:glycosyltransferase involved in cell wall biosynthesis
MRLLLIGNYLPDEQNSMLRYTEMLRREMAARGHAVSVIAPAAAVGRLRRGGLVGKWLGYIDKYLIFPMGLRRAARGFDWVHVCDHSNSMYMPYLKRDRSSITCHDLLAIEAAGNVHSVADVGRRVGFTGRTQQRWIAKNLLAAQRVLCISHATERSLRAMGARGELTTIPNPLNRDFAPAAETVVAAVRQRLGLGVDEPYLLHVAGNQWYKNRPGVMRMYAALLPRMPVPGLRLVMAGKPWTDEMRAVAAASGLRIGEQVLAVDDPSDEEVEALYTGAEALLFPSLQEGFGWPVIEAQRCGCAVITSDRDPMREIAGGAALLIDPADEVRAAGIIAAHWGRLTELRLAGSRNAEGYTTERLMPLYEAFFQQGLRRNG